MGNEGTVFTKYKWFDKITNPLAFNGEVKEHLGFTGIIFLFAMSHYRFIKDGETTN